MSLSKKGIQTNDTKLSSQIRGASLNPNAVEFVPFALRSAEATPRFSPSGATGKAVFDRSESSISNNSDDEAQRFWRHQLPDDITPDFKVIGEDESQGDVSLAFAGLSLLDGSELSGFSPTDSGYIFNKQQDLSHHVNGSNFTDNCRLLMSNKLWDNQIMNSEQHLVGNGNGIDRTLHNGISRHGFTIRDETDMNPLDFLASQFPGFAAESLAEAYFTNECDLNLTIEMLIQLEKTSEVSTKLASQDTGMWKYERDGPADSNIGYSRSSHVLASSYNGAGHGRGVYGDRLKTHGSARGAPVWLETGDAVVNMYSELREEARDHAHLRDAYFEQARQAYLIGNKALADELSMKGQLHNMHMKTAHGKAQEFIHRQRNPVGAEVQGNGRGQERMIDLHGLHVNEAIQLLKLELNVLRSTARAADRRLQVYIHVGTGHPTRGSRAIAQLPIAVQRYLLEEEGLDYSEPHPGLLQVMIY